MTPPAESYPLYPSAVIVPLLSCLVVLLDLPPIIWHIRNRNIGSAALIFWLLVLNMIDFLNAVIWPRDNFADWWDGKVFCDIQVRLIIGATIGGLPGAALCIMKSLARVLDTKKTVVNSTRTDLRRQYIIDGLLCFGLPAYFMIVMHVVHAWRYYIVGISGCDVPLDFSWVTIVLIQIWPPILLFISSYYACLTIFRLHRYGSQVSGVLTLNKTTRSRFLRLFIMSLLVVLFLLPSELYQLIFMLDGKSEKLHPYSYTSVHTMWNVAVYVKSGGSLVHWHRWMWIACGYVVFAFFGTGSDARKMYKGWLIWMGFGKLFPSLLQPQKGTQNDKSTHPTTWLGSVGSKAKLLFSRKGSATVFSMDESFGNTSILSNSPRKSAFRLSFHSSTSKEIELPMVEPSHKPPPQQAKKTERRSKWALFSAMPSFSQALAGAQTLSASTRAADAASDSGIRRTTDVHVGRG